MVGIISNSAALFAQRNLAVAAGDSESSIARLSSGNRIIRAADDVAGLAVGTSLATTVSTLKTVLGTTNQANSLLQIADGGLKNISDILARQKALAVSANSGSLSNTERAFLQQEFAALTTEIDRIVSATEFNGIKLLDGSVSGAAGLTTVTASATGNYSLNAAADYKATVADTTALSVLDATTTEDADGFFTTDAVTFAVAQDSGTKETNVTTFTTQPSAGTQETFVRDFNTIANDFADGDDFTIDGVTFVIDASAVGVTGIGTTTVTMDTALSDTIYADAIAAGVNAAGAGTGATGVTATSDGSGLLTLTADQVGNVSLFDTPNSITASGPGGGLLTAGGAGGTLTDGTAADTIEINGNTFVFVAATDVTSGLNIAIGGDLDATLNNLAQALNDATTGAPGAITAGGTVADFTYTVDLAANTLTATEDTAGGAGAASTDFDGGTVSATYSFTAGVAVGNVTTPTYQSTLQGAISDLKATYIPSTATEGNSVQFSATVGGVTYLTDVIALSGASEDTIAAGSSLQFKSQGPDGDTDVTFSLVTGVSAQTITNQTTLDTIAGNIQSELTSAGVSFGQSRAVSSFTEAKTDGTVLQGLAAADVVVVADAFDTSGGFGSMEAFNVDRANNRITTTVGGEVYTADLAGTGFDNGGGAGTYNTTTKVLTTGGAALIVFESASLTDSRQIRIDLANVDSATITFDTAEGEAALESVLNDAFAIGGGAGLTFQVGTAATDTIGVTLAGAATSTLYVDGDGTRVSLDISTAGVADTSNGGDGTGAILASNVIDRAINAVTGLRASVGALQSRFDFAASNISSAIQNTEGARSNFLDVDIADESTNFATAQVRLQASISILAQANQLPQNLLKLIG